MSSNNSNEDNIEPQITSHTDTASEAPPLEGERVIAPPHKRHDVSLAHTIANAKKIIIRSPHFHHQKNPLYQIPWCLFLGIPHSGQQELLHFLGQDAPLSPLETHEQKAEFQGWHWSWYFLQQMIAISIIHEVWDGKFKPDDIKAWQHILRLLKKHRRKLPLNGIYLSFSVQQLQQSEAEIKLYAKQYRYLIDEVYKELSLTCPIFIGIHNLDSLPGFQDLFALLPHEVYGQTLGIRFDTPYHYEEMIQQEFQSLKQRFPQIRLTLLESVQTQEQRWALFQWIEHFLQLEAPLKTLYQHLFAQNPYQYNPLWRGVYFSAAPNPVSLTHDTFRHFIPIDLRLSRKR